MNLFYSSITSLLIVGAVWFVALLQPNSAYADSYDPQQDLVQEGQGSVVQEQKQVVVKEPAKEAVLSKGKSFSDIEIVGNTQTTMLSQLDALLVAFSANESVNTKLYQQPSKIYIYYRNFSPSYDSATITVGYDKGELIGASTGVDLPTGNFAPLLKKGSYKDSDIVNAWQGIDYGKNPQAVLEIHYLNKDGSTAQNALFVSYQQGA